MKPIYKIVLIITSVFVLNWWFGMDWRFTWINVLWCLPVYLEMMEKPMTSFQKILLVIGSLIGLNMYFGMDYKFTIINIIWCIPILFELKKNKTSNL